MAGKLERMACVFSQVFQHISIYEYIYHFCKTSILRKAYAEPETQTVYDTNLHHPLPYITLAQKSCVC